MIVVTNLLNENTVINTNLSFIKHRLFMTYKCLNVLYVERSLNTLKHTVQALLDDTVTSVGMNLNGKGHMIYGLDEDSFGILVSVVEMHKVRVLKVSFTKRAGVSTERWHKLLSLPTNGSATIVVLRPLSRALTLQSSFHYLFIILTVIEIIMTHLTGGLFVNAAIRLLNTTVRIICRKTYMPTLNRGIKRETLCMRQSEPKAEVILSQGQRVGAEARNNIGYNAPTRPRNSVELLKVTLDCTYNLKVQKFRIKSLNDNIRYGAQAPTISRNAGIPINEAKEILDKWFTFYANVKPWMEARGQEVEEKGYVLGLWGLKRRLPMIMAKEADGADLKRQAGNSPIQNYASDFNCFLMLLMMEEVKNNGLRSCIRMVNTVHDSMVFEVAPGYESTVAQFYYQAMKQMNEWCSELFGGPEYYVTMRGDLDVGENYGNMVGCKVDPETYEITIEEED